MTAIQGVDIDLSAPEFWSLPWADRERAYQLLRQHQPLAFFEEPDQIPGLDQPKGPGYRAVVRHADLLEVSRRPATFCSGQAATSVIDLPADLNEFYGSLISMDDPRHPRLRRIVSGAFTPRMLQRILDQVEHTAAEVLDGIDRSSVDLVADIAAPFPLLVILDMMGVPRGERGMILESANAILSGGDPDFFPPGKDFLTAILEAGMNLSALMEPLAAARRDVPSDDLVSALIHADVEGEPITDQEVVSFFILLLVAGSETTRTAVSHGVWAFAEHPEQRQIWVDDFDAVAPTAVDEIVRWATPVISARRTVTEDVTLADTDLHAGDKLLLMYAAANRDEAVFENPHTFDVRRSPKPHVGCGGPRSPLLPRRSPGPPGDHRHAPGTVPPLPRPDRHRCTGRAAVGVHHRHQAPARRPLALTGRTRCPADPGVL